MSEVAKTSSPDTIGSDRRSSNTQGKLKPVEFCCPSPVVSKDFDEVVLQYYRGLKGIQPRLIREQEQTTRQGWHQSAKQNDARRHMLYHQSRHSSAYSGNLLELGTFIARRFRYFRKDKLTPRRLVLGYILPLFPHSIPSI